MAPLPLFTKQFDARGITSHLLKSVFNSDPGMCRPLLPDLGIGLEDSVKMVAALAGYTSSRATVPPWRHGRCRAPART